MTPNARANATIVAKVAVERRVRRWWSLWPRLENKGNDMSFTPGMADSQGEFEEFKVQHEVPCRKCGVHAVSMREWESSCGGWEDYQYRCNSCGHSWWVEGIDA